jgi:hypothetical protein
MILIQSKWVQPCYKEPHLSLDHCFLVVFQKNIVKIFLIHLIHLHILNIPIQQRKTSSVMLHVIFLKLSTFI